MPAKLKRIYKIEMTDADASSFLRKVAPISICFAIKDPDKKAKQGSKEGVLYVSLRHHRRPRSGRRPPHHRRQRQQPAISHGPRARQTGRHELILVDASDLLKAK